MGLILVEPANPAHYNARHTVGEISIERVNFFLITYISKDNNNNIINFICIAPFKNKFTKCFTSHDPKDSVGEKNKEKQKHR